MGTLLMAVLMPNVLLRFRNRAIVMFFCLLFTNFVYAQDEQITLSLENADVVELIRWASNLTDKNIIIHPNVSGRVTVLAGDPMSREEAFEVFLSVLQVNQLAIVESEDSLKVVPEAMAKSSPLPVSDSETVAMRENMIVQIVTVKNVSVSNVLNLIRPLAPQTAYMAAYPQSNKLILADRSNNIRQLMILIDRIDQAGSFDIEIIDIVYADARKIMEIIERLIPKQAAGNEVTAYNLTIDERSNSLLMTGDQVIRQQIKSLAARLDTPLKGIGNTQIIAVEYGDAEDIVPILENMSRSLQEGQNDNSSEVSIQAHPSQNSLIITAPPSVLNTFRGVIETLDVPRPQVLVEAIIVEVNMESLVDLGVEWQTEEVREGKRHDGAGGVSLIPSSLSPVTFDENNQLTLGSGLSLGYFRKGNLRSLFSALAGESNANILSTPSIVALDNQEASILVGENVPFITGSEARDGDSPFQTIERQDIGITLKVKPRINNMSSVTLEIEQSVESISQSAAATADIVTNKREISTRVLIGNDEILVLGGLIRDEVSESQSKVPLLGDIPLLGRAFRSTSNDVDKKNLMVFIHPVILDTPGVRRSVSQGKYEDMQELQNNFSNKIDSIFIPGPLPKLGDFKFDRDIEDKEPSENSDNLNRELHNADKQPNRSSQEPESLSKEPDDQDKDQGSVKVVLKEQARISVEEIVQESATEKLDNEEVDVEEFEAMED